MHQTDLLCRYIMIDVVVNNVMATSMSPDYSKYMFKNPVRMFLVVWLAVAAGLIYSV